MGINASPLIYETYARFGLGEIYNCCDEFLNKA